MRHDKRWAVSADAVREPVALEIEMQVLALHRPTLPRNGPYLSLLTTCFPARGQQFWNAVVSMPSGTRHVAH
jgi:hypothetical protein